MEGSRVPRRRRGPGGSWEPRASSAGCSLGGAASGGAGASDGTEAALASGRAERRPDPEPGRSRGVGGGGLWRRQRRRGSEWRSVERARTEGGADPRRRLGFVAAGAGGGSRRRPTRGPAAAAGPGSPPWAAAWWRVRGSEVRVGGEMGLREKRGCVGLWCWGVVCVAVCLGCACVAECVWVCWCVSAVCVCVL